MSPPTASLDPFRSVQFSAEVTGTLTSAVTWSVQEGGAGGSVSGNGLYTAPQSGGTYHVVATSQADPTKSASATVIVALMGSGDSIRGEVGGQHWTVAGSPYNVGGDLTIASGKRLKIDPGVQVIFQGRHKIDVYGAITAQGTAENRILFTAADQQTGWAGIRFCNVASVCAGVDDVDQYIQYAELSYGRLEGSNSPGAYYNLRGACVYASDLTDGTKFHFDNNFVHDCKATYADQHGGAFFWGGSHYLSMKDNVWEDNSAPGEGGAVGVVHSAGVNIYGGAFRRNAAGTTGGAVRVFDGDITVHGSSLGTGADANTPNDFTSGITYVDQ